MSTSLVTRTSRPVSSNTFLTRASAALSPGPFQMPFGQFQSNNFGQHHSLDGKVPEWDDLWKNFSAPVGIISVPFDPRIIDYVKVLLLKHVGLTLAGLWVIVLIAAVAATIYRVIDGPSISTTISKNSELVSDNATLNRDLDLALKANDIAQETIDQLNIDLRESRSDNANLRKLLDSYLTSIPSENTAP